MFDGNIIKYLKQVVEAAVSSAGFDISDTTIEIDRAPEGQGDYMTNIALSAKDIHKMPPPECAEKIAAEIKDEALTDVSVAGPGFINFTLSPNVIVSKLSEEVLSADARAEKTRNVNLEFISTNPTGQLHLGHGRSAFFGDILGNIYREAGYETTREFYINDSRESVQIKELGKTALGTGDQYDTDFVKQQVADIDVSGMDEGDAGFALAEKIQDYNKEMIDQKLGISIDNWYSEEQNLRAKGKLQETLQQLKEKNVVYEKEGATWIKTSEYGDNDDRVVVRSDLPAPRPGSYFVYAILCEDDSVYIGQTGNLQKRWGEHLEGKAADHTEKHKPLRVIHYEEYYSRKEAVEREQELKTGFGRKWLKREMEAGRTRQAGGTPTYFLADIAYHADKIARGFDVLEDVWGADHHGHVKRMQAVRTMLDWKPELFIHIAQLVSLKEDGQVKKMSKRAGTIVLLEDLVEELNLDVVRWFFTERALSTHMEFDVALAREQSEKNPVFYVQYAHARASSIEKNANGAKGKITEHLLVHPSARGLAMKLLQYPEVINRIIQTHELHRLPQYATDVAAAFSAFYRDVRVIDEDGKVNEEALALVSLTKDMLARTLSLLGISAPEQM